MMDMDLLEIAGLAQARRVFEHQGEPKTVTLDERALGQMLAFAYQIGAAMQLNPVTLGPDFPCLFTGVASRARN